MTQLVGKSRQIVGGHANSPSSPNSLAEKKTERFVRFVESRDRKKKRVTGRPNDGRTDFLTDKKRETDHGPTDGRTDRPSYRDAWAVQKKRRGSVYPSVRPSRQFENKTQTDS